MPRAHGVSGGVLSIVFVVFFLSFARAAGAQMCSNVPSGSGESIDGSIVRTDTSCTVTSGKYVLKSTPLRVDVAASAMGSCMLMVPRCWPLPCICVYSGTTQQRTINHGEVAGLDLTYPTVPHPVYFIPSNQFQHTLDSHEFNTTGPVIWTPLAAGDYSVNWRAIINTTNCSMTPGQTDVLLSTVHVRSALHKGAPNNGNLLGGSSLPDEGTGYYHDPGGDPANTDDWGGDEAMNGLVVQAGQTWSQTHASPKIGVLDVSKQGGGTFPPHASHQNGLDADIRYVRNDGQNRSLDLQSESAAYSRQMTIELLNLLAASGQVDRAFVDPAAQITQDDVPGITIVIDSSGEHINHFHIRLIDPDGDDSNIC